MRPPSGGRRRFVGRPRAQPLRLPASSACDAGGRRSQALPRRPTFFQVPLVAQIHHCAVRLRSHEPAKRVVFVAQNARWIPAASRLGRERAFLSVPTKPPGDAGLSDAEQLGNLLYVPLPATLASSTRCADRLKSAVALMTLDHACIRSTKVVSGAGVGPTCSRSDGRKSWM